ncbi:hypothetical protein EN871_18045 [bacterium M00.F.Ca.ET.228.01.1.1]|nr:hypothetical protein EN871_18045 [bacterium M00.F.Ca.ET.228.01.1.1]TGR99022.1 hypothetical protein EN834_20685 [bacterium M00.F.Ca.ET.191.01.1.1]TGU03335.1 hypothetical protein EN798_21505 [bacterium M00.F.Ca.ET.155.01.1.1]
MRNNSQDTLPVGTAVISQGVAPKNCTISAVSYQGLNVTTSSGEPAMLAVIDMQGRILDAGPQVARAVWRIALESYRNFLMGEGHLRVLCKPPEQLKQ